MELLAGLVAALVWAVSLLLALAVAPAVAAVLLARFRVSSRRVIWVSLDLVRRVERLALSA